MPTLGGDHLPRLAGAVDVAVDEEHLRTLSREQEGRRSSVPDRLAGRLTGPRDDRDLSLEPQGADRLLRPPTVTTTKVSIMLGRQDSNLD